MNERALLTAIEAMVQEKTLSLEGMKGLSKIKDESVRLAAALDEKTKSLADVEKMQSATLTSLELANKQIEVWKTREAELLKREAAADVAKYTSLKDFAVAEAYKDMLKTIFAPNYFREHITKQVPVPHTSGGSGSTYTEVREHHQSEERTVVEGA